METALALFGLCAAMGAVLGLAIWFLIHEIDGGNDE